MWQPAAAAVLCLAAVMLMCACGGKKSGRTIAVSVPAQAWLARAIVGGDMHIVTVLDKNADAETFEPTMRARKAIDDAAVYFATGLLPFEDKIKSTAPSSLQICNTTDGIELIYGTHGHTCNGHDGHGHGCVHDESEHGGTFMAADPHVWVSPRNCRIMARNILRKVIELNPDSADVYTRRHAALDAGLDSTDRALAKRLANATSRAFAVQHPSLSYFARDYGLQQIAVGFENKETSPKRLAQVARQLQTAGVRVIVVEKGRDSRPVLALCGKSDCRVLDINPLEADNGPRLMQIADALAQ